MGSCDATRRTDKAYLLTLLHRITRRNKSFAQMKITGNDSGAVIDVDDIARKKEVIDESHDSTIRGAD